MTKEKLYQIILEDILEWLETGNINGMFYDEESIISQIKQVLK